MLRETCPDLGASGDVWRVKLLSGEVVMTLDQLDVAFDAGRIDANTLVCPPGVPTFTRLGAIAGLDADADAAARDASFDVDFSSAPQPKLTRPSRFSIDLSEDLQAFRPRWSYKRLLAVPALLAVVAVIAFAASASASSDPPPAVPTVAESPATPAALPALPAPPAAVVVAPGPAPAPVLPAPAKKGHAAHPAHAGKGKKTKK